MHMYCTEKVDMTQYFGVESSYLMSVMRRKIAEEIQKRGEIC